MIPLFSERNASPSASLLFLFVLSGRRGNARKRCVALHFIILRVTPATPLAIQRISYYSIAEHRSTESGDSQEESFISLPSKDRTSYAHYSLFIDRSTTVAPLFQVRPSCVRRSAPPLRERAPFRGSLTRIHRGEGGMVVPEPQFVPGESWGSS